MLKMDDTDFRGELDLTLLLLLLHLPAKKSGPVRLESWSVDVNGLNLPCQGYLL